MEAELRSEDDVMKNGIVEESLTESPSVTPKSFDVMLQEWKQIKFIESKFRK